MHSGKTSLLFVFASCFLLCINTINGIAQSSYKAELTRILFVFDGSGSMLESWQGSTRFEIAKDLLINMVDSIEKSNRNIEFALRIYGY